MMVLSHKTIFVRECSKTHAYYRHCSCTRTCMHVIVCIVYPLAYSLVLRVVSDPKLQIFLEKILWRVWPKATIVSGIRLATIVTCSQPYPGYGCAIPRTTIGFMDTLATRYFRITWLPSNRGWVFSIGTARCCKGKAIHNSELVSLWKRKKSVSLWDRSELVYASACGSRRQLVAGTRRVSARQWVLEDSLRSEKSAISKICSN
jgi:hypothetical protein